MRFYLRESYINTGYMILQKIAKVILWKEANKEMLAANPQRAEEVESLLDLYSEQFISYIPWHYPKKGIGRISNREDVEEKLSLVKNLMEHIAVANLMESGRKSHDKPLNFSRLYAKLPVTIRALDTQSGMTGLCLKTMLDC